MATLQAATILSMAQIHKRFGNTVALNSVSIDVHPGEVHAIVGQNGSGKSTLIKILSGFHQPDEGQVSIRSEPLALPIDPQKIRRAGVGFMHQDLALSGSHTVLENVRLGKFSKTAYGRIRWRAEAETVMSLLRDLGVKVDPFERVDRLNPTEQALVGFLRAIQDVYGQQGLLVLDEPTTHLPLAAVQTLFRSVRRLTEAGSGVLFVSHRLEEVLDISDRVSVLRNGELVGTVLTRETSQSELVAMILGRELGELYPAAGVLSTKGDPVLSVRGLSGTGVSNVTFEAWPGQVLGLTGLTGMGQERLPYLVFGAERASAGDIYLDGRTLPGRNLDPALMRSLRVALLPADRRGKSGVLQGTVTENLTLPQVRDYFHAGRLQLKRERSDVHHLLERFQVKPQDPGAPLRALSGGNQQKVLLAKWLNVNPLVLLLHEPTQGVDIGSRREIFRIIRDVADSGVAIIISSVEYEDLAHLCDKVLVFRRGMIQSEISGAELTTERVLQQCYMS